MTTREEALAFGLSFPDTYRDAPFHDRNWQLVRYRGNKKAFLWTYMREGCLYMNVKAEPGDAWLWRSQFPAVQPGYHQNKDHWMTVALDGTVPEELLKQFIRDSYTLVSDCPAKRIYEAVKRIPRGRVATYGTVAALAGNPGMSRAVGNALHKNPDPVSIPCYRVVNARGELAGAFAFGGDQVQARLLQADGIEVIENRVNLEKYGWKGEEP